MTARATEGEASDARYPATKLPSGMPPRKANMKMLITRPRISSLVTVWTREVTEANREIRLAPAKKQDDVAQYQTPGGREKKDQQGETQLHAQNK